MLKGEFSTADLLLTQVNVLPELGYSIQRSVMLETQPTDLETKKGDTHQERKGDKAEGNKRWKMVSNRKVPSNLGLLNIDDTTH